MNRFAFLALFALAGCSSTHVSTECDGSACDAGSDDDAGSFECPGIQPGCYAGWGGSPSCCIDGLPSAADCVDGEWVCGGGLFTGRECGRIDLVCEGIDAGPIPIDYYSCGVPSDCSLASTTCCGTCGRPTLADFDAINSTRSEDYYFDVACPEARTEPPLCPDCVSMGNPNLGATCEAGRCAAFDVESDSTLSACSADVDCVIRVPDCCECGADTSTYNLIALNAFAVGDFINTVCDPDEACDGCLPTYPADAQARCLDGACRVVVGAP